MKQEILPPAPSSLKQSSSSDLAKAFVARIGLEKAKVDLAKAQTSASASKIASASKLGVTGIGAVQSLLQEFLSYQRARLEHERDVAEIKKEELLELERIAAQKELLKLYLEKEFAERHLVLEAFIAGLDRGIAEGDKVMVETMATQLVDVVRTPVLSRAAEAAKALESGKTITLGGLRG